ncbi:CTD small phosphatase-like protein [Monodelphis domestica]|uniref:CTD small phosphatase-like protein n=1 Tax=Monodelphis domestica TaxID=13616 RepID=UPI0024E273FB|nr:CTD small phosphatase-like protein [Monodelphis domestica]
MDAPSIITQVTNPKEEESSHSPSGRRDKGAQSSSGINLKKQRSRSIFSSLFCCFRSYDVDTTSVHSTSSTYVLPPVVEENGGLQKVSPPWGSQ